MAEFDPAIPPGGVGKITLQVDTTGFQGIITKSARVFSNDPKQGDRRIYLTMNVRPHIVVKPSARVMLRGIVGDDIRQTLHIQSGDGEKLEISSVESNLGALIEYKLSRENGGGSYQLEVINKSTGQRRSAGFLKLHTNNPRKRELRLPIHILVRSELEVWPARLVFTKGSRTGFRAGATPKKVINIVNNRDKAFHVQELNYNKKYFEVRQLEPANGADKKYKLEVVPLWDNLPADSVRVEETLIIKTDVAQTGELKVPLTIDPQKTGKAMSGKGRQRTVK